MQRTIYLFLVLICYQCSMAQISQESFKSRHWVSQHYYLHCIDNSRLIFSPTGMDTTNYNMNGDTLSIYYSVSNIKNDLIWPQHRDGWIRYRVMGEGNDIITLQPISTGKENHPVSLQSASAIRLIDLTNLTVPVRRIRHLEISEFKYLTSAGITDTSGRLVEADTTRTYSTFDIRSSKMYYHEGHAHFSWKNGRLDRRTRKPLIISNGRISAENQKILRDKLSATLWLFNNPATVNNSLYHSVWFKGNGRRLHVTGTYIHPLVADLFQFLKKISPN